VIFVLSAIYSVYERLVSHGYNFSTFLTGQTSLKNVCFREIQAETLHFARVVRNEWGIILAKVLALRVEHPGVGWVSLWTWSNYSC
jgi:hypothetical protein